MVTTHFKQNVFLLVLCQALFMSGTSLIVTTTALVGFSLTPDKSYASLPFAAQLIATMLTSIPAAMLMARIGHKQSFIIGTFIAMSGALICTYAILHQQFSMFILGCVLLGIFSGFANYYRFTAADSVEQDYKSRAISYVLAGGVLAAIIGPNLANQTRDLIGNAAFAGSYASIIALYILSFILLSFLKLPRLNTPLRKSDSSSSRSLRIIIRQPRFIIAVLTGALGYATMTFLMTATPLAMQHHSHPFSDTSFVIQWHVLGMFVPSFFTGHLIRRFGLMSIMLSGAVAAYICIVINLMGISVWHFWFALLLLGISWNFLFIGATTLLTETYAPDERFKAQATNDFLVFSLVSFASLSAGIFQHHYGWQFINYAALPVVTIILFSLLWLHHENRKQYILPSEEHIEDAINTVEQ